MNHDGVRTILTTPFTVIAPAYLVADRLRRVLGSASRLHETAPLSSRHRKVSSAKMIRGARNRGNPGIQHAPGGTRKTIV